jgi:hypothetical protein
VLQGPPQPQPVDPSIATGGFIDVAVGIAPVVNGADVSVGAAGPFQATPGTFVGYNVNVTNAGPSEAGNVNLRIDADPILGLATAPRPSQGTCALISPAVVSCQLGTLANGRRVAVPLKYRFGGAGPFPQTLTSTFSVTSDAVDPDTTNNTAVVIAGVGFDGPILP